MGTAWCEAGIDYSLSLLRNCIVLQLSPCCRYRCSCTSTAALCESPMSTQREYSVRTKAMNYFTCAVSTLTDYLSKVQYTALSLITSIKHDFKSFNALMLVSSTCAVNTPADCVDKVQQSIILKWFQEFRRTYAGQSASAQRYSTSNTSTH